MTAINVFVQPKARAGFIISDGAVTAPTGELIRNTPKIVHGTGSFPWAAGISGNVPPEIIHRTLSEAAPRSLKQLERHLPSALRRAVAFTAAAQEIPIHDVQASLRGVYWDFFKKRPCGFLIQSNAGGVVDQQVVPFTWYDMAWGLGHHASPAELLGRAVDLTDPADFDPEVDGLALITAQRRSKIPAIDITPGITPGMCRIGGDVDLTEVTKRGVRVWKIHEWPDRVGELIRPE